MTKNEVTPQKEIEFITVDNETVYSTSNSTLKHEKKNLYLIHDSITITPNKVAFHFTENYKLEIE